MWKATPDTDAFIKRVFDTCKGTIRVEKVFDVASDAQLWYQIPGFNGYEMSDYGFVRSMKFFQRAPVGILIKPDKKEYYTLSNNNNDRIKISRMDLWDLVCNNPNPHPSYPRRTNQTDCYSRNRRMFLADQDVTMYGPGGEGKSWVVKQKHVQTNKQEPTFFPKFTVINEPPDEAIEVLEFYHKET